MARLGSVIWLAALTVSGCGGETTAAPAPPSEAPIAPPSAKGPAATPTDPTPALVRRVATLPSSAQWTPAGDTPLPFATHHPQGLARLGDTWFLTTVEVTSPPVRSAARPPFDRSPGAGVGHLIAFGDDGAERGRVPLGDGTVYHPGGLDTDGERLWVPVAEYRPRGRSIVYTVDPATLAATEAFRVPDHIGAIIYDRAGDRLVGASWGARTFYAFDRAGKILARWPNPSGYVDYQDCRGLPDHLAVCGGVRRYRRPDAPGETIRVGGLEIIDLARRAPAWQMPIELYAPGADPRPMTYNATWCDFGPDAAECAFVPSDHPSTLHRYRAAY